jgi:hypothetical protein
VAAEQARDVVSVAAASLRFRLVARDSLCLIISSLFALTSPSRWRVLSLSALAPPLIHPCPRLPTELSGFGTRPRRACSSRSRCGHFSW